VALDIERPGGRRFRESSRLRSGTQYDPERSSAFRITFQYPFADIYPHFRADSATKGTTSRSAGVSQTINGSIPLETNRQRWCHEDRSVAIRRLKPPR
jgi:hypothetical protein